MLRLLSTMLRLPVAAFVYGMEMFVKTMQGMQRMTDEGIDAVLHGSAQPSGEASREASREPSFEHQNPTSSMVTFHEGALNESAPIINNATCKEETKMADQDLRGDDSKLIRYYISFTRRDLETYLGEDTEVISYSTTEGDYGGAKKAEYLAELRKEGADRPSKWKDNNYPPDDCLDPNDSDRFINIPSVDFDEFVKLKIEVLARYERKAGEYEKDQADALKKLASAVKKGVIQVNK